MEEPEELKDISVELIINNILEKALKEKKLMENIEEYKKVHKEFIYDLGSDITDKMCECYTNLEYAKAVLKVLQEYKTSDNFNILGNFIVEIGESIKLLAKEVD